MGYYFFIILLFEEHIVPNRKENVKAILILELKVTSCMLSNRAPVRYTCWWSQQAIKDTTPTQPLQLTSHLIIQGVEPCHPGPKTHA